MSSRIFTVGVELSSEDYTDGNFFSDASLLDWDIVMIRPDISEQVGLATEQFAGKPCLSDSGSQRMRKALNHWHKEIRQAVDVGKTVIVFMCGRQECYAATGELRHSGTGRSRSTTRIVDAIDNYQCLPIKLSFDSATGSEMKLAASRAQFLAPYWSDFGERHTYRTLISGETVFLPAITTKSGNKTVGCVVRSKGGGHLLLLPDFDFFAEEFFEETKDGYEWSAKGQQFSARFLSAAVELDRALRAAGSVTPTPEWAKSPQFSLAPEFILLDRLQRVDAQIAAAQVQRTIVADELEKAGQMRGLLFENGKPLERAIISALTTLGFHAEPFRDAHSEFDVVFQCAEGRLIGEAEGKDSKPINVDKLRQLTMNIQEDLRREEVAVQAKGVLFGNAHRLTPPGDRPEAFTTKCVNAAKASSIALVPTPSLFQAAAYLAGRTDDVYAKQCRETLLNAVGVVEFPPVPSVPEG